MEYTYTYDNASLRNVRNPIWWQTTFGSAGNLTSLIYKAFGQSFSKEDKKLLGVPFAQFLKLNSEFRYHYRIDKNQMIASRIAGGVIWSYGNATTAPYTEQFYIGGANSIPVPILPAVSGPVAIHPIKRKSIPISTTWAISVWKQTWNTASVFSATCTELFFSMQVMSG